MHLQRVQVPDFRVLKDIDITFEKDFSPRIFPLGSLNGGGKSTLLQLIFILLHCSADPENHDFIYNLLQGFTILDGVDKRTLAKFEVFDGEKIIHLEYFVFLRSAFWDECKTFESDIAPPFSTTDSKEEEIQHLVSGYQEELVENKLCSEKRLKYIFEYKNKAIKTSIGVSNESQILSCQVTGIEFKEIDKFLGNLSEKVLLASPSTQIFIFLSKGYRKSLFKSHSNLSRPQVLQTTLKLDVNEELRKEWENTKIRLSNFFPYDFVSVDVLIQSFKQARDKDFDEAIETGGHYGNHYKNLLDDFNEFLKDKQINLDKDLSGVNFKAERNGEIIELYPEDLSHGELKRLSLYVWLKYSNIEDAIILFDEIEISLHPDWQYQIVRDLEEWGPTNQYILATHSYALCEALTPAHVKEIEPKLLNNINN